MRHTAIKISVTALLAILLSSASTAHADSEAGLEAGSQATWGGWGSQARSAASSQATWGGWGSEASRNNSSEAGSQAGSESGFGGNAGGFRRRNYWKYFNGNGGGNYNPRNDPNSTYNTLKRLRQDQNEEQKHEAALSKMPAGAFVQNYGVARNSGLFNTLRQNNYYPAANGSGGSYPANSANYTGSYTGNYPATGGSYARQ